MKTSKTLFFLCIMHGLKKKKKKGFKGQKHTPKQIKINSQLKNKPTTMTTTTKSNEICWTWKIIIITVQWTISVL